jgi:hypothetical protein
MEQQEIQDSERELRRTERLAKKFGKNHLSIIKVIKHYISKFPYSLTGLGIRSEQSMMSGEGRKRSSPDNDSESSISEGNSEPRLTKKQVINKLSANIEENHKETMNYMRLRDEQNRLVDKLRHEKEDTIRKESSESDKDFKNSFLIMMGSMIQKL